MFRAIAALTAAAWIFGAAPALARQDGAVSNQARPEGVTPAQARQVGAAHTVSVGIQGILALSVDTGAEPLEPGVGRTGSFALTSNRDATNLVARLDEALPTGLMLLVQAETDLASGGREEHLGGVEEVVLLASLARGVRRGQALHLRVQGHLDGELRRTLSVGLVDPVSGQASWQAIPLTIRGN